MKLAPVSAAETPALAVVHAASFDEAWSIAAIAEVLTGPGAFGLAAWDGAALVGFVLARAVADEAEILTLAVDPARRRAGIGAALVEAAAGVALAAGAETLFLEVAADNLAALALYERANFARAGVRPGYYRRADRAIDAFLLRRRLNSPPA